jgi:predicted chitinase
LDGVEVSLFAGIRDGVAINIKSHAQTFDVGDATENGTKGLIMAAASLVADYKADYNFKLASSINANTPDIVFLSTAVNTQSSLEKNVKRLALASLQTELNRLVQESFVQVFTSLFEFFLFGNSSTLLKYRDQFSTLLKAETLTEVAALKDNQYKDREAIAAQNILPEINRLLYTAQKYSVTDKAQIAYLLGTVSHESQFGIVGLNIGNHNPMYEYGSINYFSNLYDMRTDLGHGGRGSGDGLRYRGRGYVQLTGKVNYEKFQKLLKVDFPGLDITATDNAYQADRITTYKDDNNNVLEVLNKVTQYSDESDPDRVATDRELAANIAVLGMRDGLFRSPYGFSPQPNFNYTGVSETNPNFNDARNIINADAGYRIDPNDNTSITFGEKIARQAQAYFDALKQFKKI